MPLPGHTFNFGGVLATWFKRFEYSNTVWFSAFALQNSGSADGFASVGYMFTGFSLRE